MLTTPPSEQEGFLKLARNLYDAIALKDNLKRIRAHAWDHFCHLGLPSRSMEVYRCIKLKSLFGQTWQPAVKTDVTTEQIAAHLLPECQKSHLVFINGHFVPELSDLSGLPSKIVVSPLDEAVTAYGALFTNYWALTGKEEKNPFAAFNTAAHPKGAFLYIPPQTIAAAPLQLLHIITASNTINMPRMMLFVGKQAEITLVQTIAEVQASGYLVNQMSEVVVEESAHVKFFSESHNLSSDAWLLNALRATLKRDSTLTSVSFTDGAMTVRDDYQVSLTGEGGHACLNGVWMLDEKREAHTHVLIDHQAPNCTSNQLFKGVLTDVSRSSFEGKIYVRQAAQKTQAYQLNNNLVLSDKANADSKPNLEIFADDVKASHGATVGQLDEEQLFYCLTRGYSQEEARNLLIYGFCEEVIDKISVPSIHQRLSNRASQFLV